MKWTIKKKMLLMGIMVFAALAFLSGMTFFQNRKVMEAMRQNEMRTRDQALIEDLRLAQIELTLAAADSMIEKEKGQVPPERMELIQSRTQFLEKHLGDLERAVSTPEQKAAMAQVRQGIEILNPAIRNELVALIELSAKRLKAIDGNFNEIDQAIDTRIEALTADLAALTSLTSELFEQAKAKTQKLQGGTETTRGLRQVFLALMLASKDALLHSDDAGLLENIKKDIDYHLARYSIYLNEIAKLSNEENEPKSLAEVRTEFNRLADVIRNGLAARPPEETALDIRNRLDADLTDIGQSLTKTMDRLESSLKSQVNQAVGVINRLFEAEIRTARLNRDLSSLQMATMDAIMEKDQGRIAENRLKQITQSIQTMEKNLQALSLAVENPRGREIIASITGKLPALTALVTKDLKNLIEKDAREQQSILDEFNKIQAAVRQHNTPVQKNLSQMAQAIGEQARQSDAALQERLRWAQNIGLIVFSLAMVLILPAFTVFARKTAGALVRGLNLARAVKDGDLSQRISVKGSDELAQLAEALNTMADSLENKADLAQTIAQGDLSRDVALSSPKDSLGRALLDMVTRLNQLLSQVDQASSQVTSGADQISESSQALSLGATDQASSLEEVTGSMIEIGHQTKTNAEDARKADKSAREARDSADAGHQHMGRMIEAMTEINVSGKEIAQIIKTIDEIAFQTNLLALNAAVEAARAGKHGKGFAVVAQEVRSLAVRSAKASGETAELIENTVKKVENGARIARQTSEALDAITASIGTVSDLVGRIASASQEQASSIAQINEGLAEVDHITQQNTANAEETASAAEELAGQAEVLRELVSKFQLKGADSCRESNDAPEEPSPVPAPRRLPQESVAAEFSEYRHQDSCREPQSTTSLDKLIPMDDDWDDD